MSTLAVDLVDLAYSLDAGGRTEMAYTVLDAAVARNVRADEALALKGDLLRSRGELLDAATTFGALSRRRPEDSRARYLSALLSGSVAAREGACPPPWPSAFVRVEDFLDDARHAEVMLLVSSSASAFEPSTVGVTVPGGREARVVLSDRISFRLTDVGAIADWLRPLIRERLPSIAARLGLAPFTVREIELKCTAYGDGNFFAAHSDTRHHPSRRVSFVYYFHRVPKPYRGGALLLYDSDVARPGTYFPRGVTRLDTLDNSVVFFPSGSFHEVERIVCPSGRFEDARFTFAGHVHAEHSDDA
ncbi:MAG: 2OG-Fe(II) oxygenase [bacterium]